MKIAIAGAGMSGAYLFRILKDRGHGDIDLYDAKKNNACGIRPCAWGFAPTSEIRRLISEVADPGQFEKHHSTQISVDGVKMRSDLLILDKPSLIRELIKDEVVKEGPIDLNKYDRVIDATGVSRAYLPPIKDDLIADTVQYRIKSEEPLGLWFNTSSIGYEWCFPLGGDEYHMGFGNLRSDVKSYRPATAKGEDLVGKQIRCKCHSSVRLTTPFYSQPFVSNGKVVGVGESIGAVAPIVADGNLYAMQTAEMLAENWDDLDNYSEKVLNRYEWMRKERSALEKMMAGKMPSLSEALTMKRHSNMVGVEMNTMHVLQLFRKMARSGHENQDSPIDPS
jgi:flavin-dependent dehydrogenase